MEILDSNWKYHVDNNWLYNQSVQLNKLDRSNVFELAKYDLTKLFEIYDKLDINSEILNKLKFRDLKSRIINKLKELRISYEIKNIDNEFRIYLPTEKLCIVIKLKSMGTVKDSVDDFAITYEILRNEVYLIKCHDKVDKSYDYIGITEKEDVISFIAKDKYTDELLYFEILDDPKERFLDQNWCKINTKPSKNLYWHETFKF